MLFFNFLNNFNFQYSSFHPWISFVWYAFPCQIYIFISLHPQQCIHNVSKCIHKPKLLLIIDLVPFTKLLDLLAINHSLSERRDSFVPHLLKLSYVLFFLQLTWVRTSSQFSSIICNTIWFSTLSRVSTFLWHSSKCTLCSSRVP